MTIVVGGLTLIILVWALSVYLAVMLTVALMTRWISEDLKAPVTRLTALLIGARWPLVFWRRVRGQ